MVFLELVSLREAYDSIDWSIIELLGVMLPLGEALEGTGVSCLFTRASS
jgi:di/tricarboxylate transporter